ncbi:hypothetical protein GCM10011611_00950 [Aliidongia dinghuensis]|uniref:Uncharacterized protein n=1 Tax=Aliidongia dinghuensis TaxID=1867774 RepID=A0A8J2YP13_9PROT|nr:hypothetical protein [Aliidongia dinghuensis]GGE99205.1 hypothetical protein GCM10011611_00950 [Aliidongia dinghuensis]
MDTTLGSVGIERRWRGTATRQGTIVSSVLAAMLSSCLFLTRFALTVGKSELSLALVVVLCGTALLVLTGSIRISPSRLGLFGVAAATLLLSVMLSGGSQPSYMSFANLLLLYACWIFVVPDDRQFAMVITTVRRMLLIIAIAGILQFFAQVGIHSQTLFNWDVLPRAVISHGFNYVIPAPGLGGLNKSNGFFLLEPSSLSQMMAIAIILELEFYRVSWRIGVLAAALALALSGTGLVLFCAIVPLLLLRRGFGGVLLVAVPAVILLGLIVAGPKLALLLDRVQEFHSDQSSGFARFLSPFFLFSDFLYPHLQTTLFGMGPGAIETFTNKTAYLIHDPTWGKLIFEYGFLGAVPLSIFVGYCFFAGARSVWLASALFVNYLLLGGNLVDARLQAMILALVVLQNRPRDVRGATVRSVMPGAPMPRAPMPGVRTAAPGSHSPVRRVR